MSKSLWNIVIMGFIAVVLMVVMMLFSLTVFQGSPAAVQAKLASQIREHFGFPEAASSVKEVDGTLILRIEFLSNTDSKFSDDFMKAEIDKVVVFTRERYDGRERRSIKELRVRRLEIQGSGCWRRKLERDVIVPAPFPDLPPKPPRSSP